MVLLHGQNSMEGPNPSGSSDPGLLLGCRSAAVTPNVLTVTRAKPDTSYLALATFHCFGLCNNPTKEVYNLLL